MKKQSEFWSRVFTFLPTPTKDGGEAIDERRLLEEVDFQIESGVPGVCVFGSTGGNGSFSDDEMKKTTAAVAKHAAGRISVVAGTGARTTSACISLTKHAKDVGCDGVMILPVSYWPLTEDEVFTHYEQVASKTDVPICVYNNPWTTGVDMKPEFLARLAEFDQVKCIKESTGDLSRISAIRRLIDDDVTLIAGWESTSLQAFMAGASGWAPVCTNFAPQLAMQFFEAATRKRDATLSRDLWDQLFPLCEFICAKSHIRVAHSGLQILGRPVGSPRAPMKGLNEKDKAALAGILALLESSAASKPRVVAAR